MKWKFINFLIKLLILVQANGLEIRKKISDYIQFNMDKSIIKNIIIPPLNKDTFILKTYKVLFIIYIKGKNNDNTYIYV